jgi:RHS repeat-associated protein
MKSFLIFPHIFAAVTWACLAPTAAVALDENARSGATLYIGRHFEVRDHEQPVKYVFDGETRVARVTGSLNSNVRVQRLRLFAGWNLCSLAVTATNFVHQATNAQAGTVHSVFAWDRPELSWTEISAGQTVPAGSILWLYSASNASLAIVGPYNDPTNNFLSASGDFLPGAGLEAWDLSVTLSNFPSATACRYDSAKARWSSRLPAPLEAQPEFSSFLAPGSAMFVQAEAPGQLAAPDSALRIRYYHQDHLGSSSAVTDDQGAIVEETSSYPFGTPRHEFQPRQIHEPYQFTQKERDRESGLQYFEARYQAAVLSRFITPDMKYADPDGLEAGDMVAFLANPQKINLYAYVLNNPVKLVDPTGLDEQPKRRVLIAYTVDMFKDAQERMKIPNRAAYHAALRAAYQQEAGPNAEVVFRNLGSWKELGSGLKGASFDTVIVNTHAFGNDKTMFLGEGKTYDEVNVDQLERFLKGAKTVPKHVFFYGCNTAKSGLAADLSGRLPNSEITGASETIKQTADMKWKDTKKGRETSYTIKENRDYNLTYKGGKKIKDARTVDVNNAELPR